MSISSKGFLKAVSFLEAHTEENLCTNQIKALICLYEAGEVGLSVGEVGEAVGISHVTASKLIRVIGEHGLDGRKGKGWGLVEIYYDHKRPRATMTRLNKKGTKVVEDFLGLLEVVK